MTVYADNAATTRMSRTALDAMLPAMEEQLRQPLQPAQRGPAGRRGCCMKRPRDRGPVPELPSPGRSSSPPAAARPTTRPCSPPPPSARRKGKKHIISTAFEHHAVLHTLKKLEKEGFEVTLLPVARERHGHGPSRWPTPSGRTPALVTVMYANNEIGTILPIAEIGAVCREKGVLFHTDAVQAAGHLPIDVEGAAHRHAVPVRPQVPRPQGRAVRCMSASGIPLVNAHRGRRPGAGQAGRHGECARHRGHGRRPGGGLRPHGGERARRSPPCGTG